MNLFIFFALPIATILLAIVFQKLLRTPILVAITFFAIYLIIAFVAFSDTLAEALIATIIYTIIAYITAYIVMLICRLKRRYNCECNISNNCRRGITSNITEDRNMCSCGNNNGCNPENNNLLRISCSCGDSEESNDLLTVNSTCLANNSRNRRVEISEPENLEEKASIQGNRVLNRPVALGNNVMNKCNLPRRVYNRR